MAELLEREDPSKVVSAMAKTQRKGKVFIDWSQNSDFKTTVCVYSLRAKQDMPYVSMPVTWEELRTVLDRRDTSQLYFSPEGALERLRKKGDLWKPLLSLKQRLPKALTSAAGARRNSPAA